MLSPCVYAYGRNLISSVIDFSASASVKSFDSVDTYASSACVSASMPVSAVIAGGTLATSSGSRIATIGCRESLTRGYLTPSAVLVITENLVTSEPVPLVVGIA